MVPNDFRFRDKIPWKCPPLFFWPSYLERKKKKVLMKLYEKSVNFDIVIHSLSYHFHTLLWLLTRRRVQWGFVHQSKCGQFKIVIDDTKHVNRPKFKAMYVKFWRTWLKPVMKFSLGWFLRIDSNSRLLTAIYGHPHFSKCH